jgi:hypothetical protein
LTRSAAINRSIRRILKVCPRTVYIGYTATPYASLLCSTIEDQNLGPDLYPKDFIRSIPKNSAYYGAKIVFGYEYDQVTGIELKDPLRKFEEILEEEEYFKSITQSDNAIIEGSLREAIITHILASAYRRKRHRILDPKSKLKRSSMLVHCTHLVGEHNKLTTNIIRLRENLKHQINRGELQHFRKIFTEKFDEKITRKFRDENIFGALLPLKFEDIENEVLDVIQNLDVMILNCDGENANNQLPSDDETKDFIVVGGNRLSRGITIHGLLTSYFVRRTNQYDTLFQMARWFGYREESADLCTLWTKQRTYEKFRDVTMAECELLADIEEEIQEAENPQQLVRIRHKPGILVCARNRMNDDLVRSIRVSYAGERKVFSVFDRDKVNTNRDACDKLRRDVNNGDRATGEQIVDFLNNYAQSIRSFFLNPKDMARFITAQLNQGTLNEPSVPMRLETPTILCLS